MGRKREKTHAHRQRINVKETYQFFSLFAKFFCCQEPIWQLAQLGPEQNKTMPTTHECVQQPQTHAVTLKTDDRRTISYNRKYLRK